MFQFAWTSREVLTFYFNCIKVNILIVVDKSIFFHFSTISFGILDNSCWIISYFYLCGISGLRCYIKDNWIILLGDFYRCCFSFHLYFIEYLPFISFSTFSSKNQNIIRHSANLFHLFRPTLTGRPSQSWNWTLSSIWFLEANIRSSHFKFYHIYPVDIKNIPFKTYIC